MWEDGREMGDWVYGVARNSAMEIWAVGAIVRRQPLQPRRSRDDIVASWDGIPQAYQSGLPVEGSPGEFRAREGKSSIVKHSKTFAQITNNVCNSKRGKVVSLRRQKTAVP